MLNHQPSLRMAAKERIKVTDVSYVRASPCDACIYETERKKNRTTNNKTSHFPGIESEPASEQLNTILKAANKEPETAAPNENKSSVSTLI
jgi:hypothetical protein